MPCDRRRFVAQGAGLIAAAVLGGCASLMTRRVPLRDGRLTLDLRQFPELQEPGGAARLLPDGWRDPLYVLVLPGGTYAALSPICTHLGCTVDVSGARLVCPCHGSTYDREGRVLQGPAERALTRYAARVTADGLLIIDLERPA
jgi:Rieske Fe-S protein